MPAFLVVVVDRPSFGYPSTVSYSTST
jgi:hypothetical protein